MTFWDWLNSSIGQDFVHALILLIMAVAAYLSYLSHRTARDNADLLDAHIEHHILDAASNPQSTTTSSGLREVPKQVDT